MGVAKLTSQCPLLDSPWGFVSPVGMEIGTRVSHLAALVVRVLVDQRNLKRSIFNLFCVYNQMLGSASCLEVCLALAAI